LSIEEWRDAVLAATDMLGDTVGGPSIDPTDASQRQRTVYSRISRLSLHPMLALFDFPDPNIHADRRVETTTPLQKLFVMNSPFMIRQAEALADRLVAESDGSSGDVDRRFIERLYSLLFGRPTTETEMRLGLEFLNAGADARSRRQQYAQ